MIPRLLIAVATCTMLAACSQREPRQATAAAGDSTIGGDSTCDLVTTYANPDPDSLVFEYLRRDGRGDFMSANDWEAAAVDCPGHEPGWDTATLVGGFVAAPLRRRSDTVSLLVTYSRVYPLFQRDSGFALGPMQALEQDTFVVLRTPFGWRIDKPVINPHVLPSYGP
jgi:hypothetical protein